MRYSSSLGILFVALSLSACLLLIDKKAREETFLSHEALRNSFQRKVGLPDLAITTAARYLRHYSLSDLTTPFQDHPVGQEHFPAGFSFAPPDFSNMPVRLSLTPVEPKTDP